MLSSRRRPFITLEPAAPAATRVPRTPNELYEGFCEVFEARLDRLEASTRPPRRCQRPLLANRAHSGTPAREQRTRRGWRLVGLDEFAADLKSETPDEHRLLCKHGCHGLP